MTLLWKLSDGASHGGFAYVDALMGESDDGNRLEFAREISTDFFSEFQVYGVT
jgi:hypothetical protein